LQRTVAAAYDDLARRHPDRIVAVDADGEIADVHRRVLDVVSPRVR
jgi:thymidylate kinase